MSNLLRGPDLFMLAAGVGFLLRAAIPLSWLERRHSAKLRERLDRGQDRYHEELRALQAYPPKLRRAMFMSIGSVALVMGLRGWLQV